MTVPNPCPRGSVGSWSKAQRGLGESAVPKTGFDPQVHGFAFPNRWRLGEGELKVVGQRLNPLLRRAVILAWAALGCLGRLPFCRGVLRLREKVKKDMAQGFGLCGGMCFAALDLYKVALQLSEQSLDTPPPPESPLHAYILRRQLHSLVHLRLRSDAARYMAWLLILNHAPARLFRGGPGWLLARSRREWSKLKASIDAGEPVPILLVRDTQDVFGNHQVLAIGCDHAQADRGAIYVYDPNCPGQVSTIEIDFGEKQLNGRESCCESPPLRGFFCQAYKPLDPAVDVG